MTADLSAVERSCLITGASGTPGQVTVMMFDALVWPALVVTMDRLKQGLVSVKEIIVI